MANTPRVITGPNQDITGRTITQDYQNPAYAATITVTTTAQRTTVQVAELTGTLTLDVATTNALIGDELVVLLSADATSGGHVVTFGTGCTAAGTLTVAASKFGKASGIFDGNSWIMTGTATV